MIGGMRKAFGLHLWAEALVGVLLVGAGLAGTALVAGCSLESRHLASPQQAGVRVFGLEVSERPGLDMAEQLGIARSAGARAVPLTIRWSAAERDRGALDLSKWEDALRLSRARGHTVLLNVSTFDRNDRLFPRDLMDRPLDDPQVLARFGSFVEAILDVAGREVAYVSFADDFDAHLRRHPLDRDAWAALEAFVEAGFDPLRERRPEISTGITLAAPLHESAPIEGLVAGSDVIFADYAFSQRDHEGGPFDHVGAEIDALVRVADAKPLIIREASYPTDPEHAGTELGQAQFVHALFEAWDAHRDRIPVVILSGMFEAESETCVRGEHGIGRTCASTLGAAAALPEIAWSQLLFEATSRSF